MAYQVLARKWRPKKFEEVVGQEHITRSLQNAILQDKLGHAYLFTGTRGVGKTSVARIFAKAIRCENRDEKGNPCSQCSSCLDIDQSISMDVIELDGASNNKVDDIKSLLETIHTMPMFGKYKIYIVDEVHMLSNSAFNALLKTLEEPPEHVLFIFATTEPHQLLGTVLSRCQRFDFRHVSTISLVEHVKYIAKVEGISFSDERLIEQICELGQGSVRDTLSILDQVLSFTVESRITEDILVTSLGLARDSALKSILSNLLVGNIAKLRETYRTLINENVDVHKIVTGLLDVTYDLISNIDNQDYLQEKKFNLASLTNINFAELFWIFETLNKDSQWALNSVDPVKSVELVLFKITLRRDFFAVEGRSVLDSSLSTEKKNEKLESEVLTDKISESVKSDDIEAQENSWDESVPSCLEEQKLEESDSCLTCGTPIIEEPNEQIERNWENFLEFLEKYSPGGRARLDQGDISYEPVRQNNKLKVELCYKKSCEIFYEHIQNDEVKNTILELMGKFYAVEVKNIDFEVTLLEDERSFLSRAERKEQERLQLEEDIKNNLREHELVKKAEEIFSSKVDQVRLK